MPNRRAEDAVHVVITDHLVQRFRPARDLTAPLNEAAALAAKDYRGEVALYYPSALPSTPQNELYLALAQVQQGSNLMAGIPRLQQAIERHNPTRAEFYYELARAYSRTADHAAAIRWSETALQHNATFAPALKEASSFSAGAEGTRFRRCGAWPMGSSRRGAAARRCASDSRRTRDGGSRQRV